MFLSALSLAQWSHVAEIVAGVGVTLVAIQVWLGVQNSRVELITGMTTLITQVDQVFVEYPRLRQYFGHNPAAAETNGSEDGEQDGVDVRSEREQALAVAVTIANVLDHVVEHMQKMKGRTRYAWRLYIAELYEKSPVFQEVLTEHGKWWPGLQKQVDRGYPKPPNALWRLLFRYSG